MSLLKLSNLKDGAIDFSAIDRSNFIDIFKKSLDLTNA